MFKKPCYWLEQLNSQSPLRLFVAWETIKRNEKTFNDQCDKNPFTLFYTRTVDKVQNQALLYLTIVFTIYKRSLTGKR